MRYPKSETVGFVTAPDGEQYSLDFYGEDEGAAVVTGPWPGDTGRMVEVPEIHREPADNVADARAKLKKWCDARGWK